MIPAEAVEAAAKVMYERKDNETTFGEVASAALEAAAPYMLTEAERELFDAQRVIALLVGDAGGKVTISRESITKLPADTVIETTQDVVNGGWVIRVRPTP